MHKQNKKALTRLEEEIYRAHVERGAETEEDFLREGFSLEEMAEAMPGARLLIRQHNPLAA